MPSDARPREWVEPIRPGAGESEATWKEFGIVLAAALAVRAVLLPWLGGLLLAGDENYYWSYLLFIQDGDIDQLVLRPPLWSYAVAATRLLFEEPMAVRGLVTVIGALAPPLVYLLGTRAFDRRTGLIAAAILTLYPEHIGYSHYIWGECFFTTLILFVVHLFFLYFERRGTGLLVFASLLAGVAVLSKVFAAIAFGGVMFVLLLEPIKGKAWKIALASVLFALPPTLYSVYASQAAGRRIVLSETGLLSMRQAVGLDPAGGLEYYPDRREAQRDELMAHLQARPLPRAYADVRAQLYNLWTPNSFVSRRLLASPQSNKYQKWLYGMRRKQAVPLAILITTCTIFVTILGLAGLCLGARSSFRTFSIVGLSGLCCTAAIALLASRYRFPFTFLLLLPAAALVADPRAHFARLRDPWRAIPLVLVLALYASVVLAKRATIGSWG